MWIIYFALFLGVVCQPPKSTRTQPELYDLILSPLYFVKFMTDYNKHYQDYKDLLEHYEEFKTTLRKINVQNSDPSAKWQAGINKFSDYTDQDKKDMFGVSTTNSPFYISHYTGYTG